MSTTVDQRIVSMEFDNSKFDSNVRDTVQSVEDLKSSLNFDEAQTSFQGLTDSARAVDLSGIEKSLNKLNKHFSAFGIASTQVITSLTNYAMKMGKRSMDWLTKGVIQGGLNRAKNIQQAKFQLSGLGIEWDKISEDIDYAVNGTAYGMDSAAKAASSLVASSVKLGDEMKTALRGISGTAAMTNSTYDDIANIFTTVAGNGRLMGDQLNQLSARGLNAAATLGKAMGKSEEDIRKMVSKGEISFKEFAKAMDDAFGEHAKKANVTFQGSMSNVKAALGRLGEVFITPLIKDNGPMVKFFNTLRVVIDNIKRSAADVSDYLLKPVTSALKKATQWTRNLYHVTGDTFVRYSHIFEDAGGKVKVFEDQVRKTMKANGVDVKKLEKKYGGLREAVNSLGDKKRQKILVSSFDKVQKVWGKDSDSLMSKIQKLDKVVTKSADGRTKITKKDKDFIKALKKQGFEYNNLKKPIASLLKGENDYYKILSKLSKEEIKSLGATKQQVSMLRHMQQSAKWAGMSLEDYVDNLRNLEEHGNGGALILKTIKNVMTALLTPLKAVKDAFYNVFGGINNEVELYNLIYLIEQFSEKLIMSKETVDGLTVVFTAMFTILKDVGQFVGGVLAVAFQAVADVLKLIGKRSVDASSDLGGFILGLNDNVVAKLIDTVKKLLKKFLDIIDRIVAKVEGPLFKLIKRAEIMLYPLVDLIKVIQATLIAQYKYVKKVLKAYLIDTGLLFAVIDYGKELFDVYVKKFKNFLKTIKQSDTVKKITFRLQLLHVLFNKMFGEGPKRIKRFVSTLKKLTNASVTDVKLLKEVFKNEIVDYFFDKNKWKTLLSFIKDAFVSMFSSISYTLTHTDFKGIANALFSNLQSNINDFIKRVKKSGLKNFERIGMSIVEGLSKGLANGSNAALSMMGSIGEMLLSIIKNILGIHSPSTKFIEIGKNIIQGLIIGLKKGIEPVRNALATIFTAIENNVPNFLSKIAVIFGAAKGIMLLVKFAGIIKTFVGPIFEFSRAIEGMLKSITAVQSQMVKTLKAAMWVEYALALMFFADALKKLGGMTIQEATMGLGVIAAAMLLMVGISFLLKKVDDKDMAIKMFSMVGIMLVMGHFLEQASRAFVKLGKVEDVQKAIIALTAIVAAMLVMVMAASILGKDKEALIQAQGLSIILVAFGQSLLMLADALRILGRMKADRIEKAGAIVGGYVLIILALAAVTSKLNANTGYEVAAMLLGFSVALILLGIGLRSLGTIDPTILKQASEIAIGFAALCAALAAVVTRFGGAGGAAAAGVIVGFAASLVILSIGIKKLGALKGEEIDSALAVIHKFGMLVGVVIIVSSLAGKALSAAAVMVGFSLSLVILGKGIKLLAGISRDDTEKALYVVEQFAVICAIMIVISSISKNSAGAGVTIIAMAGAIFVMAAAVALLSFLNPKDLWNSTLALTLMMAGFAAVLKYAGKIRKAQFKSLIVIAVTIGELMAAMIILAKCDIKAVWSAAGSIVSVFVTLAVVISVISKVGDAKKVIPLVAAATGMLAVVTGALVSLAQMPTKQVIAAGAAISGGLLAFSAAIWIVCQAMEKAAPGMIKIVGIFALVVGIIIAAFAILDKFDINPKTETVKNLIAMLLAFTAVTAVLALIGPIAPAAIAGAFAMGEVVTAIVAFLVVLGGLFDYFKSWEGYLDKGLALLKKIFKGLGEAIGSLFGGIVTGFTEDLPKAGMQLTKFMMAVNPFLVGVSKVDKNSTQGVKNLADALMTFMAFEKTVDATDGQVLVDMTENFATVGEALVKFVDSLEPLNEKAVEKMKNAAKAAKYLAEFAAAIPNEGGLVSGIVGENTITSFVAQFEAFGEAMADLKDDVKGINEKTVEKIRNAADAARALADFAAAIPNEGGMASWVKGDNTLKSFSDQLPDFGTNLKAFSTNVKGLDPESCKKAAGAAGKIINVLNEADYKGGNLKELSKTIGPIGEGIGEFYESIEPINVATLAAFDVELKALVQILKGMGDMSGTEADGFKNAMKTISKSGVEAAAKALENSKGKMQVAIRDLFSSLTSTAKAGTKGINFGSAFKTALNSALKTIKGFKDKFSKSGTETAAAFSKGFNGTKVSIGSSIKTSLGNCITTINNYKDKFNKAGANVSAAFSKGFNNKKTHIGGQMTSALSNAIDKIKAYKDDFKSAGENMVKGFAKGIEDNKYRATNAGKAIAKAAYNAAKKELNEHSPSRVMKQVGKFFTQGFAIGIENEEASAKKSAETVARTAMGKALEAVSEIDEMINNGINIEPVIAPVIDTTSLSSGLSNVEGMMNASYAFGLGGSVNMSRQSTADMVASIVEGVKSTVSDLLDNQPEPTYTFDLHSVLDGREIARSTATYTQEELNKLEARNNRQLGFV